MQNVGVESPGGEGVPELPDLEVYLDALRLRVQGQVLRRLDLLNPFLLRTVDPPARALHELRIVSLSRIGKRIVFSFESDFHLVLHLMVAGRLHWLAAASKAHPRGALAGLQFDPGRLVLTEAGTRRRASLHVVRGEEALHALDPGGIEPLTVDATGFAAQLRRENHTLKRALTDPSLFSGIGNAYSDEILHRARLSPLRLTHTLSDADAVTLYEAVRKTLTEWTERLRQLAGDRFPEKVTAFRAQMAVHGRFGQPCPVCATPVQRIVYADNETNYCPRCQTGGRILADRALSRLLKETWPRHIDDG